MNADQYSPYGAGKIAGAKAEQERIIKLLEDDMKYVLDDDGNCIFTKHFRESCNCEIIALIKEENK